MPDFNTNLGLRRQHPRKMLTRRYAASTLRNRAGAWGEEAGTPAVAAASVSLSDTRTRMGRRSTGAGIAWASPPGPGSTAGLGNRGAKTGGCTA